MNPKEMFAFGVFLVVVLFIATIPFHFKKLKGHRGMAFLCWLTGVIVGSWILMNMSNMPQDYRFGPRLDTPFILLVAMPALWLFLLPFCVRCYFKWILGETTVEEQRPGMEGIRAWLSPSNVVWALIIAFCAWTGYGYSFWGVLALTILALLAYPIGLQVHQMKPAIKLPVVDLSTEREKVLQLLEQGKITANESADLLSALGASLHIPSSATVATPSRRLIWIGTALVFFGFFMPWFTMNPGMEVNRMATQMRLSGPQEMQGFQLSTHSFSTIGPDVQHGLGWMVLLTAIAVSALPYFAPEMKLKTRHLIALVGLGVGLMVMLSLLTQNLRFAGIGILFCLAGYAVCILGAAQEWRASEYSHP